MTTTRLGPIDSQHPSIVALMYGPLVLFPIADDPPSVTRQQLLAVKRIAERSWRVSISNGAFTLLPFTEISDQTYTTYLPIP